MILYLRNGIGIPAHGGFIPKGLPGFNDSIGYSYNPTKAKALVQEYIKRSKNPKPSLTITTNENYLQFCEFIQRALLDIGLNVSIEVMPASALKTAKANGKLTFLEPVGSLITPMLRTIYPYFIVKTMRQTDPIIHISRMILLISFTSSPYQYQIIKNV